MREITNAYDAWHFLYHHPAFMLRERHEITPEEYAALKEKGFLVTKDTGGKCWREMRHLHRHAIEMNLSIFYAKVDETGHVNDDRSKNVNVECWLEFGPEGYDYWYGTDGDNDWDTETGRLNYHDTDLDTGAPTFDEALMSLAKLAMEKYGDYNDAEDYKTQRAKACGEVVPCADCRDSRSWMRKHGLELGPSDVPQLLSEPSTSEEK